MGKFALLFFMMLPIIFATSPFTMNIVSNTLYQNTNSTPLAIYSITHSTELQSWLGAAPSNMLKVADQQGGSVTISSIVYSVAGYNMSDYMLVEPDEYYKFNYTTANFIGQWQPQQTFLISNADNNNATQANNMIADILALFSIVLIAVRFLFLKEHSNRWVIVHILAAAIMIFAAYFYLFPPVTTSQITYPAYNAIVSGGGSNTIIQYPAYQANVSVSASHIVVNSEQFIMLMAFLLLWILVNFILAVKEFLDANVYTNTQ